MCGIVAVGGGNRIAAERMVRLAMPLIEHRGIRSTIMDTTGGAMGHSRLPIVGLGTGFDQPVRRVGSAGNWLIAFVGEILDFRERNPNLECDLEVVTRGWLRAGPKSLLDRDGFWAVVALSDEGNLHILCDYLAQKPMYYRADIHMAASELDPIVAARPVTPDRVYMASVIKWGYCPDLTRTPYEEIKHVLPGEHVVIQDNGQIRRKIVDPLVAETCTPQMLRETIEDAVKRRVLSSDVPVACLLSGGLDSSIVYTLASRHGDVRPYYVEDEKNPDNIERLMVANVAKNRDVQIVQWTKVTDTEALSVMQEPIDLGSLIPQVALSLAVKERVCLTGDGADEAFGGYGRASRYDSQASDLFQELPAWHLPRLDRVMMRNKIEVRSPFLARRVVQMAMGLPWKLRQDKLILRNIFVDDLGPEIGYRAKKPLRTKKIEDDREAVSRAMVEMFWRTQWPDDLTHHVDYSALARA